MTELPDDPTLDEVRDALAPLIGRHAAFDGWNVKALDAAAREAGMEPAIARLAFDADRRGGNALAMIDAWFAHVDRAMRARVPDDMLAGMGVSKRITALVEARLALLAPDRESLRRALALLAMPHNLVRAAQLGWRSADHIWRAAGDTATDYNHYTKRMTLSTVYAATMLVFLDDESADLSDTRAFLARRIAGIGRFERAKARMNERADMRPSLSRFVGRLRYHGG